MDFAKEEANLVFEDRCGGSKSPGHQEDSEDDDNQKEMEEMLYSHVYYDDSSINQKTPESTTPSCTTFTIQNVDVMPQSGFLVPAPQETPRSKGRLPRVLTGCKPSQFNKPGRTKASRYYDVNQDKRQTRSTFVAPKDLSHEHRPSNSKGVAKPTVLSTQFMARSTNEKTYSPSVPKYNTNIFKEAGAEENIIDVCPIVHSVDNLQNLDSIANECGADKETAETHFVNRTAISSSPSTETSPESRGNENVTERADTSVESGNAMTPVNSPRTSKAKQQSFEAKISKVISSMLDEESRSSIEENPSTSLRSSQNLKNTDSGSGWSVGMSWADMSSKYNFEVDSIEEESVSSLQLREGSAQADSRTNTPDLASRSEERDKEYEESEEPSRYTLHLKNEAKTSAEQCGTDSESEVGSVVEVAPPEKPAPPLVDLSDGEYTPKETVVKRPGKTTSRSDEIVVLYSKKSDTGGIIVDVDSYIEDTSDDDLMILDEVGSSKTTNLTNRTLEKRIAKRHSTDSNSPKITIPPKRVSYQSDKSTSKITPREEQLQEQRRVLLETPDETPSERLDRWLHNPIKSAKYLDHAKFLKKMSDDPKLWRIIPADSLGIRDSPRGPKCDNCNQFGHKKKSCKGPKKPIVCHMCGAPGHSEPRCPGKMCLKCGKKNNVYTDRCKQCVSNSAPCKICKSRSHVWNVCPDLWRRYHLTTSPGEIVRPGEEDTHQAPDQWCSNCAANGHLSHECKKAQWKCESISPFIKSYADVNDEETNLMGVSSAIMPLTDKYAVILSSPTGKELLKRLSLEFKVTICTSFDIPFKKLSIEGTSLKMEKVRNRIKCWIQEQEDLNKLHLAKDKVLPISPGTSKSELVTPLIETFVEEDAELEKATGLRSTADDQESSKKNGIPHDIEIPTTLSEPVIVGPQLPRTLPTSFAGLADLIESQLKILGAPIKCGLTVRELYNSVIDDGEETQLQPEKKRNYSYLLNMILIGQCGFNDGFKHVQELKKLYHKLMSREGSFPNLFAQVRSHYFHVFGHICGLGLQDLVDTFYSNDELVKKFDPKSDSPTCPKQIVKNRKRQLKEMKLLKRNTWKWKKLSGSERETILEAERKLQRVVVRVINVLAKKRLFKERKKLDQMYRNFVKNRGKVRFEEAMQAFNCIMDLTAKLCCVHNIRLKQN